MLIVRWRAHTAANARRNVRKVIQVLAACCSCNPDIWGHMPQPPLASNICKVQKPLLPVPTDLAESKPLHNPGPCTSNPRVCPLNPRVCAVLPRVLPFYHHPQTSAGHTAGQRPGARALLFLGKVEEWCQEFARFLLPRATQRSAAMSKDDGEEHISLFSRKRKRRQRPPPDAAAPDTLQTATPIVIQNGDERPAEGMAAADQKKTSESTFKELGISEWLCRYLPGLNWYSIYIWNSCDWK